MANEKDKKKDSSSNLLIVADDPKMEGNEIVVNVEVTYNDHQGNITPGKSISLYADNDFRNEVAHGIFGANGKCWLEYHGPAKKIGSIVILTTKLDDNPNIRKSIEVSLIPENVQKVSKFLKCVQHNFIKRRTKIIKYCMTNVLIFTTLWGLLKIESSSLNFFFALMTAAFIYWRRSPDSDRWKYWVIGIIGIGLYSLFFVGPLIFACKFVLASLAFYLIEEVTYQYTIKKDEQGRKILEWNKIFNFYPTIPILFAIVMILVNLFNFSEALVNLPGIRHSIDIIGGGLEYVGLKEASGTGMEYGQVYTISEVFGNREFSLSPGFTSRLANCIDWLLGALVLFAVSFPQELFSLFQGKQSDLSRIFEKGVFLTQIFDWGKAALSRWRK
jgi:hypothetical protein